MIKPIRHRIHGALLTCIGLTLTGAPARAVGTLLIGDSVSVDHFCPSAEDASYHLGTVLVEEGVGDRVSYYNDYDVNIENASIFVNFNFDGGWTTTLFNGLVVSQIDAVLTGVSFDTNVDGWDSSRLTFTAHSVSANWNGLLVSPDSYLTITLRDSGTDARDPTTNVADGGMTLAMLGSAMAGLIGLRRKRRI